MSADRALYYPYIHFRDERWLKSTLLVFPKVLRMIPEGYDPKDSPEVHGLQRAGLFDGTADQSSNCLNSLL